MEAAQITYTQPAAVLNDGQRDALLAMDEAVMCARENGTAQMTLEEINKEIALAREEAM